jgi:hypothetical protein
MLSTGNGASCVRDEISGSEAESEEFMGMVDTFVLTSLSVNSKGDIVSRNVGVTFSLHEAELHRGDGVRNDYDTFQIDSNWQEDAATTALVNAMREFRSMVEEMQREALR